MGLTISWELRSDAGSDEEARQLVARLRQRALDMPFEHVGEVLDLSGEECNWARREDDDPDRWLLIQACQYVEVDERHLDVLPRRLIAFSTWPGEGSEAANFGLCRYAGTIAGPDGKEMPTGLVPGWHWRSFCKTQYASNPEAGGIEMFLRCHLGVVRMLDYAKELGILGEVADEGGYWEGRDVRALAEEVSRWNAMVAGFVGGMKDLLPGQDFQAEITKFPNFEHLEAKGREEKDEDEKEGKRR